MERKKSVNRTFINGNGNKASRRPPRRLDGAGSRATAGGGDALATYLRSIADIPVLTKEQSYELARTMEREERKFRSEIHAIPYTAHALVERWKALRDTGHVTGALCKRYRDGSGRDWSRHVDRRLRDVERRLAKSPAACGEIATVLEKSEVEFNILRETGEELAHDLETPGAKPRRRLGLARRDARKRLARARTALELHDTAKRTFVQHNLRLVIKCARRFRELGVPFLDLIQEGNLGLIRAVEKFDYRRGLMFSTYAVWWINQSLIRVIQNQGRTVRIPSHICELQLRYRRTEQELARRVGRDPEPAEIGKELGIGSDEVERIASTMAPIRSIHAPLQGLQDVSLEEAIPDPDVCDPLDDIEQDEVSTLMHELVRELAPRERSILSWRFGLGEAESSVTLSEIGSRLGISRERVRQIEAGALDRLRTKARARGIAADRDFELPNGSLG